jgi:hypothetical protein
MTDAEIYRAIEGELASPETRGAVDALPAEDRDRLYEYWTDRATGELTTALSFEYVRDDLEALKAPKALVELATRAIAEEHLHSDWCLRLAEVVGGAPARAHLSGTRPLALDGASADEQRLLRTVFGCCFSETVAVHVLRAAHRKITLPAVRRLNHQHLREEVGHARLGWALLGWSGVAERDRAMIARHVPEMLRLVRELWLSTPREGSEALAALGYLSTDLVSAALEEAVEEVVVPGLAELGIR